MMKFEVEKKPSFLSKFWRVPRNAVVKLFDVLLYGADQGKANDRLLSDEVDKLLQLDGDDRRLLETMIEKLSLSARAYYRTIKVARTIADLDKSVKIQRAHLIEAVGYHRFNY